MFAIRQIALTRVLVVLNSNAPRLVGSLIFVPNALRPITARFLCRATSKPGK